MKIQLFNVSILCLLLINNLNAQGPAKPKPISESQLVKNGIINQTKEECALPKYYKTEKLSLTLLSKAAPYFIEVGVSKVILPDSINPPKYIFLKNGQKHPRLITGIAYPIDSVYYERSSVGWNSIFSYRIADSITILEYIIKYDNPEFIDENSTKLEVFRSKKKVKEMSSSYYSVDYYYWAMSKGGTVRLYHETGIAAIDKKGKVIYAPESE
jgi:hypothetical protein